MWVQVCGFCGAFLHAFIVSTGPEVGRASRLQDLPEVGSCPLVVCSLILSVSLPCSRCVACKYGSISRSKGIFSAVWGFRVGLCCLGGLRGLCGFCTRVELGGLKVCGVFASVFIFLAFICCSLLLLLSRFRLPLLVLLSSACPLSLWVVVSFSLSVYTQKERARRVGASSLRVLCVFRFL